jgi:methylthioribose-1-phosphate isomerase
MIGIAAAFSVMQEADRQRSRQDLLSLCDLLKDARPTAVNLSIYMERMKKVIECADNPQKAAVTAAEAIYSEDIELCQRIASHGNSLIQKKESILTICNTGSLATAGVGTALGVIKEAHRSGKKIHVFVCETRPLLQGARLTAWELEKEGICYTLICDSMAGSIMQQGRVDRVIVGADRIAINGDFANKIGTYSLAALARYHQIPFHVAAPYTTIDTSCLEGEGIVIEEREAHEVRGAKGSFGTFVWSPKEAPVYNPAFDVTPSHCVTSFILDCGVFTPQQLTQNLSP